MQKTLALTFVLLLVIPAGSFAQEPVLDSARFANRLATTGSKPISDAAYRSAREAVNKDGMAQFGKQPAGAGRKVLIGALIGAAAGFLVISVGYGCTQSDCGTYQLMAAGVGAGIGAGVGYALGR